MFQRSIFVTVLYNFRSLYWYEESNHNGLGTLMTSKVDGSDIKTFFNNSDEDISMSDFLDECNCPENPHVTRSFVIDMTNNDTLLYWVDPWAHHITVSDMYGCLCKVVVNATEKKKYGFPPMAVTVDSKYIYWYNSTEKIIYYTNKFIGTKIEQVKSNFGYKIMALDPGSQPYPPRECLFPISHKLVPRLISQSANSITLNLPQVSKPDNQACHHLQYEMTATEYTVFYRLHVKNDSAVCDKDSCSYVTTTSNVITLNELKPFTNYTVMLEATNYYAKLHEIKPLLGDALTIQTAAEGKL